MHLPGGRVGHPAQQGKALRLGLAGGVQGFCQAGTLGLRQGPAAAQTVQPICGSGRKVRQFQLRGSRGHSPFAGAVRAL